ncbi:hypothetical protein DDV21_009420 [Streptococcus chenjunshii]|uniref:Uncharacterized protein n=1 Tax=Streptococcus chenjunshii TaxID=2173853 RepID=A0A372KJG2_9STRE|nr:hypothetical protein DDV21_009420 [Streptococcus chenjunshii]RFU50540.1 hypothetical protein DDV22_08025 [Streptococcus chenjunshii]RFU52409.1 hypothetical protein DDV23_09910 [Streptococcus chenjunshii]
MCSPLLIRTGFLLLFAPRQNEAANPAQTAYKKPLLSPHAAAQGRQDAVPPYFMTSLTIIKITESADCLYRNLLACTGPRIAAERHKKLLS